MLWETGLVSKLIRKPGKKETLTPGRVKERVPAGRITRENKRFTTEGAECTEFQNGAAG